MSKRSRARKVRLVSLPVVEMLEGRILLAADAGISGYVYKDLNGSGAYESGDPGIANVTITVYHNSTLEATTTTGSDGSWSLTGLPKGDTLLVYETIPSGTAATGAAAGTGGGTTTVVNAAELQFVSGSSGGDSTGNEFLDASISTTTSLTSSLSPSTYGQSVKFTATVTGFPSVSGTPAGTVTFKDGSNTLGTGSLSGSGSTATATYTTNSLLAGSHSITAVYGGNSTFPGSTSSVYAQTVNKATPTITWATPAAITYGTALSATQLDATASTGGAFAYTPASGTVLGAGNQNLSVTFTPTDTTDYTTAADNVTLTVNKAQLTVTANNLSKTYGTANPTLTDTITGFVNGDNPSVVSGSASLATTAGTSSTVGTYTITAAVGTLSAANYTFTTFNNGTLTVNKATPTITWATPAAITYGAALSATRAPTRRPARAAPLRTRPPPAPSWRWKPEPFSDVHAH